MVLGLAADGHPEEGVEDGVGGVRLVVVVADSPGLGAVGVQQLYRHLPALTELKKEGEKILVDILNSKNNQDWHTC